METYCTCSLPRTHSVRLVVAVCIAIKARIEPKLKAFDFVYRKRSLACAYARRVVINIARIVAFATSPEDA